MWSNITNIAYITSVTVAEYISRFLTHKTLWYLTLGGELWGVFCEDFGEKWSRYNSIKLYSVVRNQWMAHDDLVMQGPRASAATVLSL